MNRFLFIALLVIMGAPSAKAGDVNPYGPNYHDWDKGNSGSVPQSSYPQMSTTEIPEPLVDAYSHENYNYASFPEGHPFAPLEEQTYTVTYQDTGMYKSGDYLPSGIQWRVLNNYASYGLPSPGRGEEWLYSGREAVLITRATSKIRLSVSLP